VPINVMLPPKVRALIYTVMGLVGVALTATDAVYAGLGVQHPNWLTIAWAVYGVLGGGFGFVALSHTPTTQPVTATTDPTVIAQVEPGRAADDPDDVDEDDPPDEVDEPEPDEIDPGAQVNTDTLRSEIPSDH
jgi:hypothetical protein